MPTPVLEATYYISKGQKVVGPCTVDDIHSYLAYGSVRHHDLVRREGATEWCQLSTVEEFQLDESGTSGTAKDITTRRRTAHYRDYRKVPINRRAGVVTRRLILGFLFFPPLLWKAAIAVFQDRIYTSQTDAKGYLVPWPRFTEPLVTGMLIVNSLFWGLLFWWIFRDSSPLSRDLTNIFTTGYTEMKRAFGE